MASRALLQRASVRRVAGLSPRVCVPSNLSLFGSLSIRGIKTNTNISTPSVTRNTNNGTVNTSSFNSFARTRKYFSTSSKANKELSQMSEEEVEGLKVQEERLMRDLHETCEWGKGEVWGR